MNMKNRMLAVGFLLAVVGCSPRIAVDTAQNIDFSKYRTYAWMKSDVKAGENPLYYNEIASRNVEQTVENELTTKGLRKVKRTRTVATNNGPYRPFYGPYYGWGRWGYAGWGPGWWGWNNFGPQYQQEQYQAGTLVVDMVDYRTKRLVWRGSVQNAVNDPARIGNQLAREVRRIVDKFPERGDS
jgi:hypothetical protein